MGDHKEHGINIDPGYIRELAEMLDATGLSEIEVEDGTRKIRVARTMTALAAPMAYAPAPVAAATAATPAAPADDPFADATRSPMVGTVYLSPEPGAAPYTAVGAAVVEGDTILIIEAMKVMNPITAPRGGTLKSVHVENSQPVEYDQPLFTLG